MLEVELIGSACGLIGRVHGGAKNNLQALLNSPMYGFVFTQLETLRVKNNSYWCTYFGSIQASL